MTLAEVHVKWSVILIDRLDPDILLALWMKGQVLHQNQSLDILIYLNNLSNIWQSAPFRYESRKTLEEKFIFQIGTLNPIGINERSSFY